VAHIDAGISASVQRNVDIVLILVGAFVTVTGTSGMGWKVVFDVTQVLMYATCSRTVYVRNHFAAIEHADTGSKDSSAPFEIGKRSTTRAMRSGVDNDNIFAENLHWVVVASGREAKFK
jgi:hypothetical protein